MPRVQCAVQLPEAGRVSAPTVSARLSPSTHIRTTMGCSKGYGRPCKSRLRSVRALSQLGRRTALGTLHGRAPSQLYLYDAVHDMRRQGHDLRPTSMTLTSQHLYSPSALVLNPDTFLFPRHDNHRPATNAALDTEEHPTGRASGRHCSSVMPDERL